MLWHEYRWNVQLINRTFTVDSSFYFASGDLKFAVGPGPVAKVCEGIRENLATQISNTVSGVHPSVCSRQFGNLKFSNHIIFLTNWAYSVSSFNSNNKVWNCDIVFIGNLVPLDTVGELMFTS